MNNINLDINIDDITTVLAGRNVRLISEELSSIIDNYFSELEIAYSMNIYSTIDNNDVN